MKIKLKKKSVLTAKRRRRRKKGRDGTRSPKNMTYEALLFVQRDGDTSALVMFHAAAKEVLAWAEVGVLSPESIGHQRAKREAKVRAINKFLLADSHNIIPTAVVLAFTRGAATFVPEGRGTSSGLLSIAKAPTSANIVDGQHRIYGMQAFDPDTQVPIVALLEADDLEKAFQFLVINNKSTRVPASHAKAVLASMKETELANRLLGARLAFDVEGIRDVDILNTDKESPFRNLVDWSMTDESTRTVQATAIEVSLAHLGNLSVPELDDRDVRRSIFATMWKAVKTTWPDLWGEQSRLLSKVGVVCLTRFMIDTITKWADSDQLEIDLLDLDQIDTLTKEILQYMDPRFWTQPWAATASGGFDTNQGRERVVKALTQLYRNGKRGVDWATDIEIVEHFQE